MASVSTLLSICIPTYNRDYLLDKCLEQIVPSAQKYGVPIFISDNASPDNTVEVVEKHRRRYAGITLHRHLENVKYDRNIETVLSLPRTRFRWLLGDGYTFAENDLQLLLATLEQADWDVVVLGDSDHKRTVGMTDTVYRDPELLLRQVGWHMTMLSCLVYNQRVIEHAEFGRYYDTELIQTGIIFEYIAKYSCLCKLCPDATVGSINMTKRNTWYNRAIEIFARKWYLFVMSLPYSYSYEAKMECIRAHGVKSGLFTFKNLIYMQWGGIFNIHLLRKYRFFIGRTINTPIWILTLLALCPRFVFALGRRLKKMLSR